MTTVLMQRIAPFVLAIGCLSLSCSRLQKPSKDECLIAAKRAAVLHGGDNASTGLAVMDGLFPSVVTAALKQPIDLCLMRATKYDVECIVDATSKKELRGCGFYSKYWKDL